MITNNPSGPEGEITPKDGKDFDLNAVRKLEELGLSNKASKDLANLKAEVSDSEKKDKVTKAVEQQFPGENNKELIKKALSTLEQSRDEVTKNLSQKFKSERTSLAENIDSEIPSNETSQSSTKNIGTETTDGLKAFVSGSLPEAGKLVGKFFTDIPKAFSDIRASTEYVLAKADGIYTEPKA